MGRVVERFAFRLLVFMIFFIKALFDKTF
jgi:hypothetical protein